MPIINFTVQNQPLSLDQLYHDSTLKRLDVDYSRTINPITMIPFQLTKCDIMVNKIAGKKFKSLLYVKHAFNNFKIKEQDIFKTAAVTPEHHVEFCRGTFGYANALACSNKSHLYSLWSSVGPVVPSRYTTVPRRRYITRC